MVSREVSIKEFKVVVVKVPFRTKKNFFAVFLLVAFSCELQRVIIVNLFLGEFFSFFPPPPKNASDANVALFNVL